MVNKTKTHKKTPPKGRLANAEERRLEVVLSTQRSNLLGVTQITRAGGQKGICELVFEFCHRVIQHHTSVRVNEPSQAEGGSGPFVRSSEAISGRTG
jgi:hypothetical protein